MTTASAHYSGLLAPVYSWMVGGADAAFRQGASELSELLPKGSFAVDLGAGFGMHAVPLGRAGWNVLAIDSSPTLLDELAGHSAGLPVTIRCDDLLAFAGHLPPSVRPDLILCMGDTLTHLDDLDSLTKLITLLAAHLACGGRFVATFRDYSRLPVGAARFIPVRSDKDRILTCFLEEFDSHVLVHDILHEWKEEGWKTKVSGYRKLRLDPDATRRLFEAAGFRVRLEEAQRGMLRLIAEH